MLPDVGVFTWAIDSLLELPDNYAEIFKLLNAHYAKSFAVSENGFNEAVPTHSCSLDRL